VLDDGLPKTGLDDLDDSLAAYDSPMHGHRPAVRAFPDRASELDGLTAQVKAWLADGVEPNAIGVTARQRDLVARAKEHLKAAGILAYAPSARSASVKADTMHGMKGLEFSCVAVIGVDDGLLPPASAIPAADDDLAAHQQALQRERCLLFVACTRARDALYVSHSGRPSPFLPH
jgi:superfamily I DNA/RNA helicase